MTGNIETMRMLLAAARGDTPVDLLIRGGNLVNVFSCEIEPVDVAVHGSVVVGFGDYPARRVIDASGKYVSPALWDGHFHLESSMVTPAEYARAVLPHGSGTVVMDPHEIANVLGLEGIKLLLDASEGLPVDFLFMLPSCVPASHLETSGAELTAADLASLKNHPRVLGLAEVMNFPGVIQGDEAMLEKLAQFADRIMDGHATLLAGKGLNAYLTSGIGSDHECTRIDEAREKLAKGMRIMIRQGSQAQNLADLLPLATPENSRRIMFVTDDTDIVELVSEGHMNRIVRKAVEQGLNPVTAIQMAGLNTAEYFGLRGRGAVAPGYRADITIFEDLESFAVNTVIHKGRIAFMKGEITTDISRTTLAVTKSSMNVSSFSPRSFEIQAKGSVAWVIGVIPGQITTVPEEMHISSKDGLVVLNLDRDIIKIAVLERHRGTGNIGCALVRGFNVKSGALGSSVAHDSHNLIVAGSNDFDMYVAAKAVVEMGGGQVVVRDGQILSRLALPIAGLISNLPAEQLAQERRELLDAAHVLGCAIPDPFMALSFLALPVIPSLKITDRGLVDVDKFEFVPLFVDS